MPQNCSLGRLSILEPSRPRKKPHALARGCSVRHSPSSRWTLHSRQSPRRGSFTGVGREAELNGQENPPYSVDFTDLNCVPGTQVEFISRNLG